MARERAGFCKVRFEICWLVGWFWLVGYVMLCDESRSTRGEGGGHGLFLSRVQSILFRLVWFGLGLYVFVECTVSRV